MPRFFSRPTALGFTTGAVFGVAASNAVGFFTSSTIKNAVNTITNGTCPVTVEVSAELLCTVSKICAEAVTNSTTLRVGLCVGGAVLGGLFGLLAQYPQEKVSHGNSLPNVNVRESSNVIGSDTQQLILESDPEATETTSLFHKRH